MVEKKHLWSLLTLMMVAMLSIGFTSCSKDDEADDGVDTTPITLFAGDNKTIMGADTISTSNRFVAYATKNVVHGWHVGEATLLVNGRKSISITVEPKYHLYDDPICNWGCDMNYVKANQKQGTLSSKSTSTMLVYDDAGAASNLVYTFENGKLKAIGAIVSTKHSSQYASYLAERFLMLPYYKGEDTYFIGADNIDLDHAKTVVVMEVYSASQIITLYMPASDYSTSSTQSTYEIENRAKSLLKELSLE